MRFTAFTFALRLSPAEEQVVRRHAGAARFAYNQGLALLNEAYQAHKLDPAVKVPYSNFDLINTFNAWKRSPAAGQAADGTPGLSWRGEVLAQVFEEALVDLSRGVKGFFDARKKGGGTKRGFPTFKKRGRAKESFRIRNKKNDVRIDTDRIRLPRLGALQVWESTRRLRRLLRPGSDGQARAKVLFATVSETAGRWYLRINVEAAAFHRAEQHPTQAAAAPAMGMDRGLHAFAVGAMATGEEVLRETAPKPLARKLRALRRASRRLARKQKKPTKRRSKARRRLARLHAKVARIRSAFVHNLSSRVVKTHAHVALEDLHVAGMLKNRSLARSISDAAWSGFASQVVYKGAWYNCQVTFVDRFYPSSKRCHRCAHTLQELSLSQRVFECPECGLVCDRDTNAAANCALFAEQKDAAVKQTEAKNARGGEGSGHIPRDVVKPAPMKRERWTRSRGYPTSGKDGVGLNVNAL
jgi:putative transposase